MIAVTKMTRDLLVYTRTVFLFVAFVHLVFVAVYTLSIDTTVDQDPRVQAYYYIRWFLLTCWFNMITLIYLPTRLYCEWNHLRRNDNVKIKKLTSITDVVMTGILVPTTVYADLSFWFMYKSNASLMAPAQLWAYMPEWAQHSLHTVSAVVVFTDLLLTPRARPRSEKIHLAVMFAFLFAYFFSLHMSLQSGLIVYSFLEHMTAAVKLFFIFLTFVFHWMVFKLQWVLVDFWWGKNMREIEKRKIN